MPSPFREWSGLAATQPVRHHGLVVLSIVAKFTATVFLLVYYAFGDRVPMILLSGLGDALMGGAILAAAGSLRRSRGFVP